MKYQLGVLGALYVAQVCLALVIVSDENIQDRITRVLGSYSKSFAEHDDAYMERLSQFRQFVKDFDKAYGSDTEVEARFLAFRKNMEIADLYGEHETGTAQYGITQFSDMSEKEMRRFTGQCKKSHRRTLSPRDSEHLEHLVEVGDELLQGNFGKELPKSIDWAQKGLVGPVTNQGFCGSSWAYAATAALETAHALDTNGFERVSKQQLIDCDSLNDGCCGGIPHLSYLYISKAGGIELDKTYHGKTSQRRCHFNRENAKVQVYGLTLFTNTSATYNEILMEHYVAESGTIAVNINPEALVRYQKGIIRQSVVNCVQNPDRIFHSVTLVGFGEEGGVKYWNVKNSWGKKWGEKGYFRIERGSNMCGLAFYGVAPVVRRPSPPRKNNKIYD